MLTVRMFSYLLRIIVLASLLISMLACSAIEPTPQPTLAQPPPQSETLVATVSTATLQRDPTALPFGSSLQSPTATSRPTPVSESSAIAEPSGSVVVSPTRASSVVTPSSISEALSTELVPSSSPVGKLLVKIPEGCRISYSLQTNGEIIGYGDGGTTVPAAVGTYDVILHVNGGPVTKPNVAIGEGVESVVDFAQDVGLLRLTTYPGIHQEVYYDLYKGTDSIINSPTGRLNCVVPGHYTVKLGPFSLKDVTFDVDIAGNRTTEMSAQTWPQQIGLLSFNPLKDVAIRIFDAETGKMLGDSGFWTSGHAWLLPGTYRVVISEPYIGVTYEGVKIEPGQETILQLPD